MNRFSISLSIFVVLSVCLYTCTSCTTEPPVETNAVEFKNKDNTVLIRLAAEPDRLNPFLTTSGYARPIHSQVFIPLLEADFKTFDYQPALAKGRPIAEDITEGPYEGGVQYTYELYENATFSDGKPVRVEDIIFSYKLLFNYNIAEAAPFRSSYAAVAEIVPDPANAKRFTVVAKEKYILAEDSYNTINIYPEHIFDPEGLMADYDLKDLLLNGEALAEEEPLKQFATQFTSAPFSRSGDKLIGAGPYLVKEWKEGQYITMARNPNWWADDVPGGHPALHAYPDSLVFKIITDQATAANALRSEEIDLARTVDANTFLELKESDFMQSHYSFFTPSTFNYYFVAINNKDIRFTDKRVRRALAHIIDIPQVIDKAFAGLATPLTGPISPKKSHYNKDLELLQMDIEKAKALLSEAGWEDTNGNGIRDKMIEGELVEMEVEYLFVPGGNFGENLASIVKDGADQVGISIELIPHEINALFDALRPRNYQLYGAGAGGYHQPDDLMAHWHTSGNTARGQNRWQFGGAETDALIEEINRTLDAEKRHELYQEFQRIVYDEQPIIFLFAPMERVIISKRFEAEAYEILPNYDIRSFKLIQ